MYILHVLLPVTSVIKWIVLESCIRHVFEQVDRCISTCQLYLSQKYICFRPWKYFNWNAPILALKTFYFESKVAFHNCLHIPLTYFSLMINSVQITTMKIVLPLIKLFSFSPQSLTDWEKGIKEHIICNSEVNVFSPPWLLLWQGPTFLFLVVFNPRCLLWIQVRAQSGLRPESLQSTARNQVHIF